MEEMKCINCGTDRYGTYYRDWKNNYLCSSCIKNVQHCVSCGQFCDTKAINIGMGSFLCRHCQEHFMMKKDCAYVVNFVKNVFRKQGLGEITSWRLKVMDAETIIAESGGKNVLGLASSEHIIYMFRHLSKVAFAEVLAHEMLHIWQFDRKIRYEPFYSEGFCNLGSYVVLKAIGNAEAMAKIDTLESDTDPIYGDGYRFMKNAYSNGGWSSAIKCLIENSGYAWK